MAAGVPAAQIAVSDGGQVICSEAFGMTDRESAIAATPRSVLQAGSITKQFTAQSISIWSRASVAKTVKPLTGVSDRGRHLRLNASERALVIDAWDSVQNVQVVFPSGSPRRIMPSFHS